MRSHLFHYVILWWSYLVVIVFFLIFLRKITKGRVVWGLFWLLMLWLFVRTRWREPQQVIVVDHLLEVGFEKNIVLLGDLHLWVFKDRSYLTKVVKKVNQQAHIDAVLIAWDFTYEPLDTSVEALTDLFSPLSEIQVPVFAVLWNHDVQHPGPAIRNKLIQALNSNDVIFLHNDIYGRGDEYLVWLWPRMSGEDDVSLLDEVESDDNVIVLTHNPDTIELYRSNAADLTLVWHTHCGQIRIPYLQQYIRPYIYPITSNVDCGWYPEKRLFITPGLGEVMLPLRFLNPPTINVLRLR